MVCVAMACSGGTSYSSPPDAGSFDGAGFDASGEPPLTAACEGDVTSCLWGKAAMQNCDGGCPSGAVFTAAPRFLLANLVEVFDSRASSIATQLVARDGSWAFSGLRPWSHYYVQIQAGFDVAGAGKTSVSTRVGPLAIPSGGALGPITVKPVQLDLLEQRATGGAMQLVSLRAHVFDPTSGAEVVEGGATVSIDVGGTATPVPWATTAYFVQFATPPPAQASYVVTTTIADAGPSIWMLLADPPTFDGVITSPAAGANVPSQQSLSVTWPEQPAADFEVPQLYLQGDAGWAIDYPGVAEPIAPEAPPWDGASPQWTIPAPDGGAAVLTAGGTYLLDLSFTKANCPVSADGCVLAAAVAAVQFTAN